MSVKQWIYKIFSGRDESKSVTVEQAPRFEHVANPTTQSADELPQSLLRPASILSVQETLFAERDENSGSSETVLWGQEDKDRASLKMSEDKVPSEWKAGDVIVDIYEVLCLLGEGGMGKVYKVHHRNWNVDIAVKTPRQEVIARLGGKENFVAEAETWVNLGLYQNIASAYYVRVLGGIPRVFAEYVPGGSLEDWIRSRRLYEGGAEESLRRLLDIAVQFACGLHYIHEQGLVHQDVKPANVMMTVNGIAKVTDFGLAKTLGGTREYFSPEQAEVVAGSEGEFSTGAQLTHKTDLWSWGLVVLEMLAGERLWMAGNIAGEALRELVKLDRRAPWLPEMPVAVADLLKQCFMTDPEERPRDMLQVIGVLKDVYRQETGEAYPRAYHRVGTDVADNLNNRAASLLDLGRAADAKKLWLKALESDPHHLQAIYNLGLVRWRSGEVPDEVKLIKNLEEARRSYESSWGPDYLEALVYAEQGSYHLAIDKLQVILANQPDNREAEAVLENLRPRTTSSKRLVRTFEPEQEDFKALCLGWSGRLTYSLGNHHQICIMPDGQSAVSERGLWRLADGKALSTFEGHTHDVHSISLSPDGKLLISGASGDWRGDSGEIRLWDVSSGHCLRTIQISGGSVQAVYLSNGGRYALIGVRNEVSLWDMTTGLRIREFKGETGLSEYKLSPWAFCTSSHNWPNRFSCFARRSRRLNSSLSCNPSSSSRKR